MLKLIRLIRLKRIFSLFDASRVNKLADALFSNTNKSKKVVYTLIVKNFYNVIRLILLTIIITYFTGAIFYLFSDLIEEDGEENFRSYNNLITDDSGAAVDPSYQMITASYFSITTLSTVGYGDLWPVSNGEKIFIMIISCGCCFCLTYIYILLLYIDNINGVY